MVGRCLRGFVAWMMMLRISNSLEEMKVCRFHHGVEQSSQP